MGNKKIIVEFVNIYGDTIEKINTEGGSVIIPPKYFDTIIHDGEEYDFVCWDKSIKNIQEDTIIKAVYEGVLTGERIS